MGTNLLLIYLQKIYINSIVRAYVLERKIKLSKGQKILTTSLWDYHLFRERQLQGYSNLAVSSVISFKRLSSKSLSLNIAKLFIYVDVVYINVPLFISLDVIDKQKQLVANVENNFYHKKMIYLVYHWF